MLNVWQYTLVGSDAIVETPEGTGQRLARVTGSHHPFKHPIRPGLVAVPHPRKDIPPGAPRSIERRAGERIRR